MIKESLHELYKKYESVYRATFNEIKYTIKKFKRGQLDNIVFIDEMERMFNIITDTHVLLDFISSIENNENYGIMITFYINKYYELYREYSKIIYDIIYNNPDYKKYRSFYLPLYNRVYSYIKTECKNINSLLSYEQGLVEEYSKFMRELVIIVDGRKYNINQISSLLKAKDENMRKNVWATMIDYYKKNYDILDDIFEELLKLRHKIAVKCGYDNYYYYRSIKLGRLHWTHDVNQKYYDLVYRMKEIKNYIAKRKSIILEKDILNLWDASVIPCNDCKNILYNNTTELINGVIDTFYNIDYNFGAIVDDFFDNGIYDIFTRRGKRTISYSDYMPHARQPILFVNLNTKGGHDDLMLLAHELGHVIHYMYSSQHKYSFQIDTPFEVAEVSSTLFEMLFLDKSVLHDKNQMDAYWFYHIETILAVMTWSAVLDEYQFIVYTHPYLNKEQRKNIWFSINKKYLSDYYSYEKEDIVYSWPYYEHIFETPLYAIEYGIALTASISAFHMYQIDSLNTIRRIINFMKKGNTDTVENLYRILGTSFYNNKDKVIKNIYQIINNYT